MCGLKLTDNIDGVDLFSDKIDYKNRPIYMRLGSFLEPDKQMMVRKGDYKFVAIKKDANPEFHLFDLKNDPFEMHDLAANEPQKLKMFTSELDQWFNEILQAENVKIHPIIIGFQYENPVRLSRHELVSSYSKGWFSQYYLGYYPLKVVEDGNFSIQLNFRDTIKHTGKIRLKLGPIGRSKMIDKVPCHEI